MIVADFSTRELRQQLAGEGLALRTGPLVTRIVSSEHKVIEGIARQYADYPVAGVNDFADFHVAVVRPHTPRRWWKPQAFFLFDGQSLFHPLPADQAFPLLEWGMNWCISTYCHQYLLIHAAVVARDGNALILPAPPGSGKSTLCAALIQRGWRLLSDELAVIEPNSGMVVAIPRPVSLKNASIDIVKNFAPKAVFNPSVFETVKGTVAHMKAPGVDIRDAAVPACPAWVVLPRYQPDSEACLTPLGKAQGLMQLAENSFNYSLHGKHGFETLGKLIEQVDCYHFTYSKLDDAIAIFAELPAPQKRQQP